MNSLGMRFVPVKLQERVDYGHGLVTSRTGAAASAHGKFIDHLLCLLQSYAVNLAIDFNGLDCFTRRDELPNMLHGGDMASLRQQTAASKACGVLARHE